MNFIPVYLICFLIFIVWLFYEQRKSQKQDQKNSDEFWAREAEANRTRKKDISQLPLLHVQESEIPLAKTENASVLYYIDHISSNYRNMMKILIIFFSLFPILPFPIQKPASCRKRRTPTVSPSTMVPVRSVITPVWLTYI